MPALKPASMSRRRALLIAAAVAAAAVVVAVVVALAVVLTRPPAAPTGTTTVTVDASSSTSSSSSLSSSSNTSYMLQHGVNRAPRCETGTWIGSALRELGVTLVRTHDQRALDWWVIFPDPAADPENPASYNFTLGDALFQDILDAGLEPYMRLGTSWPPGPPTPVPTWSLCPNATLFARVSVHIVQHYNDGAWAGGFAGKHARFWEIWNEPDGTSPLMWCGTPQQFYSLFNATVYALKAYDPTLVVGGPGVAHVSSQDYSYGLLGYIVAAHTPIDFFSWHSYSLDATHPESHLKPGLDGVRAYLDQIGLAHVAQHNSEWNAAIVPPQSVLESPLAAAYIATGLTLQAQHGGNVSLLYPACQGVGSSSWGLIKDNGDGTVSWRRETYAYLAVGQTLRDTPVALPATSTAATDFSVLAGRSASTGPTGAFNVSIVLSAQSLATVGTARVVVTGLPTSATAHALVQLIDASRVYATVLNGTVTADAAGSANVTFPFLAPAVARVQLFVPGT